jgi:(p)ppGpp synthase/HD superfamily hydrolase
VTDPLARVTLTPAQEATYAEAIAFATERHRGQLRKGTELEYVTHPIEAGALLARYYPDRPALVTAGFLHDTLEDTRTSRDELAKRFGEEVARLVVAVTKRWWKAPWSLDVRDPDVVRLKAADCASNIRATILDLRQHGSIVWKRFGGGERAKRDYYRKLTARVHEALPREPLILCLMELARLLEAERPGRR